jgi:hypothetical protein
MGLKGRKRKRGLGARNMKSPFKKILTPLFISFIILSIMSASCASAGTNSSHSAERQEKWIIEYTISGGFAGIRRQLIINSSGYLTATDQKLKKDERQQISQNQLAEIINILEHLNYSLHTENASKLSGRCADCFIYTLSITAGDRKGKITLNDLSLQGSKYNELIRLLSTMLEQALK